MSDLPFSLAHSLALERHEDDEAIDRLNARIFGPGRFARTAARLREGAGRAESLCFTARVGTLLVGSIRCWKARVGVETPAVFLGPLTIEPIFQQKGIGGALMRKTLAVAKSEGIPLVFLIGDPTYYVKYGFVKADLSRFPLPTPENPLRFQVLEMVEGALEKANGALRAIP
jgi:predicted N-acetyltransferase YhbS